jgi:hypothetical protein
MLIATKLVARTPNNIATKMIHISTTPKVYEYLEDLVLSGLYGKSPAEAAERLIGRGVEALMRDGSLRRRGAGARGK